jgi:hypothetical protein
LLEDVGFMDTIRNKLAWGMDTRNWWPCDHQLPGIPVISVLRSFFNLGLSN